MAESRTVIVERPTVNSPWGLRLSGGLDCNHPLTVAQVRKRSLAEKAGLKIGDLVTSVAGIATNRLTHQQVLDLIGNHRLSLTFGISVSQHVQYSDEQLYDAAMSLVSPTTSNQRSLESHGLLAYLPINTSYSSPDVSPGDMTSPGGTANYTYRTPAYKPVTTPPLKSYQPFDMTGGKPSHYAPSRLVFRPARPAPSPPSQQLTYDYEHGTAISVGRVPVVDTASVGASHSVDEPPRSSLTKVDVRHKPAEQHNPSFWSQRTSYYNTEPKHSRSCAQSRTFYVLEAVMNEQGAGARGLPFSPTHATTLEVNVAAGKQPAVYTTAKTLETLRDMKAAHQTAHAVETPAKPTHVGESHGDEVHVDATHAEVFSSNQSTRAAATHTISTAAADTTPSTVTTPAVTHADETPAPAVATAAETTSTNTEASPAAATDVMASPATKAEDSQTSVDVKNV